MRNFIGYALLYIGSLSGMGRAFLTPSAGGMVSTTRALSTRMDAVNGGPNKKSVPPAWVSTITAMHSSRESSTRLFAKATYKNFEDMLAKEPGALLVDFYATWCGPCKMMSETLAEIGPKMKDEMRIFKIDSDKYPSLMTKFGVNGLPTLILFKEGKELNRIEGVLPPEPLMQQVRYWLNGWEVNSAEQSQQTPASSDDSSCKPQPKDACAPPPQDSCTPPPRNSCAPPPQD